MNHYGIDGDAVIRLICAVALGAAIGVEGVSLKLRNVEKRDGHLVGLVEISGRPEAAVCRATARLASLGEVTDLVLR